MSKPKNSVLVLDGETVKLRIEAERQFTGNSVHIDWVRFTCRVKNAPVPHIDVLFPEKREGWDNIEWERQEKRLQLSLKDLKESEFIASAEAHELARQTAEALGPDFSVDPQFKKGMDFYKYRWSIILNGTECGWVGFLSSSDSPRQSSQSETIHVNLFGMACTFAQNGWNHRVADLVDETEAVLTRSDLALDFFDGCQGGIDGVRQDYREGLCNVGGRKLKFNLVGDWENGHDRSIYIGSREAGKVTNIYEKGDQLFGHQSNSEWLRFELRYGNKLRVLSSDILRRPDDFFAGASDWHQSVLLKAARVVASQKISVKARLPIQTVTAECARNIRWMVNTAASTLAVAVNYLKPSDFVELIAHAKLPGRLRKFSTSQIAECIGGAVEAVTVGFPSLVLDPGTVATYSLLPAGRSPNVFQAA